MKVNTNAILVSASIGLLALSIALTGAAYIKSNRYTMIKDEDGTTYTLDKSTGKIDKDSPLPKPGTKLRQATDWLSAEEVKLLTGTATSEDGITVELYNGTNKYIVDVYVQLEVNGVSKSYRLQPVVQAKETLVYPKTAAKLHAFVIEPIHRVPFTWRIERAQGYHETIY